MAGPLMAALCPAQMVVPVIVKLLTSLKVLAYATMGFPHLSEIAPAGMLILNVPDAVGAP
jgi:hypothetical protein